MRSAKFLHMSLIKSIFICYCCCFYMTICPTSKGDAQTYVPLVAESALNDEFKYSLDDGYPIGRALFGSISGVDIDKDNNVIIFHRGTHVWNVDSFDRYNNYRPSHESPINQETVVTIDPTQKKIIRAWGRDTFFMPHGLSLDRSGNHVWLTDCALHQVMKYTTDGIHIMTKGTAFEPGTGENHFCKPTSVADTGDFFFVADGYCNSRVAMFNANGKYLSEFGQSRETSMISYAPQASQQPIFDIPHKITFAEQSNMLYVADRENGRIQGFSFEPKRDLVDAYAFNGAIQLKYTIADPLFNGKVFSLDYSPYKGGILIAVSGRDPGHPGTDPVGFVYNATTAQMISRFNPPRGEVFGMAHDLAITRDEARSVYVVDITPVNLWKFSRPYTKPVAEVSKSDSPTKEISNAAILNKPEQSIGPFGYLVIMICIAMLFVAAKKFKRQGRQMSTHPFSPFSNNHHTSINSLFSDGRFNLRPNLNSARSAASTRFSRRAFFNLFERNRKQPDFTPIPEEESDNSDDGKSDSDVEEFNINHANPSVKIDV